MSISVNGQSVVPPGFRFHPTEEELLTYYLKKKVASERIDLDVIRDVDLNKLEPWDIQEKCRIGSGPQNDWYLFSHKDKKYPTGTRTNRATAAGFWKATGRDKAIYSSTTRRIGMRKTLVFYRGRAPHGQKSDWIMHEYRLNDDVVVRPAAAAGDPYHPSPPTSPPAKRGGAAGDQQAAQEEGWVICKMFKKKNLVHYHAQQRSANNAITTVTSHTAAAAPSSSSKMAVAATMESSCSSVTVVRNHVKARKILHSAGDEDAMDDHILQYSLSRRGPSCLGNKQQDAKPAPQLDHRHHLATTTTTAAAAPPATKTACPSTVIYGRFMKLPHLEHVGAGSLLAPNLAAAAPEHGAAAEASVVDADWGCSLDRLAAYDGLNGLSSDDASKNTSFCFDDPSVDVDGDLLWSLARSVSSSFHAETSP